MKGSLNSYRRQSEHPMHCIVTLVLAAALVGFALLVEFAGALSSSSTPNHAQTSFRQLKITFVTGNAMKVGCLESLTGIGEVKSLFERL